MQPYDRKANKFRFAAGQSQSATLRGPAFYFGVGHSTVVLWGHHPRAAQQARAVAMLLSHFNEMLNWSSSFFTCISKTRPQDKDGHLN